MKTNRVYEVARELGVPLKAVHLAMGDLGYRMISSATPMAEDEVRGVAELLRAQQSQPTQDEQHDTSD